MTESMEESGDTLDRLRAIGESLIDPDFAVQLFERGYPDAILVVNDEGMIKLVNAHLELLFGYHRSELYDKSVELLISERSRESHIAHRQNYQTEPRTRPMGLGMILSGRHKTGREVEVEISLSPIVCRQGSFTVATIRRRRIDGAPGA